MELCGWQWVKEEMWGDSNSDVGKLESFQSMSWDSEFSVIPRGLSLVLLWGWKNGYVSLAADETGFPGGWLPDVIHPRSAFLPVVVAIWWQLSPQAKWKEEWFWVPALAGTCKKMVFFFFIFLDSSNKFISRETGQGYSEAAVFTQCHCFLKGCPLPKPHSLRWEGSRLFYHPAAIV